MAASGKAQRQPWNRSTRLNEAAPKRSAMSGDDEAEAAAADGATAAGAHDRRGLPLRSGCRTNKRSTARFMGTRSSPQGRCIDGEGAGKQDERERTRAMIERAVSAAFGTALVEGSASFQDSAIDGEHSTRDQEAEALVESFRPLHDKENDQTQQRHSTGSPASPTTVCGARKLPQQGLACVRDKQQALRDAGRRRREQREKANAQTQRDARSQREFHRRLNAAAVEFHARKHAIQALYERVQREIQYLAATASDLDKRQLLLEDAFTSYERALRAEYDQDGDP